MLKNVEATERVVNGTRVITIDGYSTCRNKMACIIKDIAKAVQEYSELEAEALLNAYTDGELECINEAADEWGLVIEMNENIDTYFMVRILVDAVECENIETTIELALENANSDLVREWAKSIAMVSVTDYEGGYCLSIIDNAYIDFIVEVENLNDLIVYADPDTFAEFSDFEAILEARYCKHYSKGEVIALIQSGFFNTWSNLFWYELAGNNFVDINIVPVSDCEELTEYFLTEIQDKSNVDKFDSFGFLDQKGEI